MSNPITCGLSKCVRKAIRHQGLCRTHFRRLCLYGDVGPEVGTVPRGRASWPVVKRFCSKLIWTNTCVEWTGKKNDKGYGRVQVDGKQIYAHRLSYELFVGPIPLGLTIDHLCENHSCVWPLHLEAVSLSENSSRYFRNHRATHCVNGHEFTEDNTQTNKHGWRSCRICANASSSRSYHRRRA